MFKVLALDVRSPASIPRVLQHYALLLPLRHLVVTPGLRAARARKGNDRFAQFFLSQRRNPHREETSSHPTAERGRGLRSRPGKASSSQIPSKNPWRGKRARARTNPRQNDAAGGGRERQQPRKKKVPQRGGRGRRSPPTTPNNDTANVPDITRSRSQLLCGGKGKRRGVLHASGASTRLAARSLGDATPREAAKKGPQGGREEGGVTF